MLDTHVKLQVWRETSNGTWNCINALLRAKNVILKKKINEHSHLYSMPLATCSFIGPSSANVLIILLLLKLLVQKYLCPRVIGPLFFKKKHPFLT